MRTVEFMVDAKEPRRIVSRTVTKSSWLRRNSALKRCEPRRREAVRCFTDSSQR